MATKVYPMRVSITTVIDGKHKYKLYNYYNYFSYTDVDPTDITIPQYYTSVGYFTTKEDEMKYNKDIPFKKN